MTYVAQCGILTLQPRSITMYSVLDKAIVAFLMGVFGIVGVVWHPLNISDATVASIVSIVTPLLVYIWPNAPKDS